VEGIGEDRDETAPCQTVTGIATADEQVIKSHLNNFSLFHGFINL